MIERDCSKCGAPTTFKDNHIKRRGYWCGKCRSAAVGVSMRKNRDAKRANNRAYAKRNKDRFRGKSKSYRGLNPEKYQAHTAVGTAIRNGTLIRKACEVCGNKKVHAHHDDYSKKLDVLWLCSVCHTARHAMLKAREEK